MLPPEQDKIIPGFREALEAQLQGFAEAEKVIYAEKCAALPRLTFAEGLARFTELYELALALGHGVRRHPVSEERHVAETVAVRQIFARVAGLRPTG